MFSLLLVRIEQQHFFLKANRFNIHLSLSNVEKELLKQKRELENARLQLDLDKSKFQNHKERLYNKPHTPSPTTTTTMTTTTTTATQISTLKPISTPLSSINNLNQHENCRNTLQSTMPCANRTLLSEAWVAPQMSDVLKRKYSSNSCTHNRKTLHYFDFLKFLISLVNILIATFEFSGGPKRVGGIGTAYTQVKWLFYLNYFINLIISYV